MSKLGTALPWARNDNTVRTLYKLVNQIKKVSKHQKEQNIEGLVIRKLEAQELTEKKIQELIDFLYVNLGKFGDDLKSIEKCFEYLTAPDRGGSVYVAQLGNTLAGVTTILNTRMSHFIPEYFLVYIAVNPDFRGQGIGKQVLDKAKSELKGSIALHVEPENPAKRLYEREGFTNKYLEMRYNP